MINKLNQESRRVYNEKIKQVFSGGVAEGWDTKGRLIKAGKDNIVYDKIKECGHDGMSVLDIGCATGGLLLEIDQSIHNCRMTGIDISHEMIKQAQRKADFYEKEWKLINYDFLEYDFGDDQFDMVVLKFVLHHMADAEETLKKAIELLGEDGILLIYTPGGRHLQEVFGAAGDDLDILGRKDKEQLLEMLLNCGAEQKRTEFEICNFQMEIDTFDKFIEFLKRIGSYQKIVRYQNMSWNVSFTNQIRERFENAQYLTGEYILITLYTK